MVENVCCGPAEYIPYSYLMVGTELAFKVSVLLAKFGQWKMRVVVVQLSTFRTLYLMVGTELAF
jgi:hypothetical protein